MFSRISSKRWVGCLEGNDSILFNFPTQALLAYWLSYDVDRSFQNFRQTPAQRIKSPEISKSFAAHLVGKTHHDINVGSVVLLPSRRRAKQRQAGHTGSAKLLLVGPQSEDDFIPFHATILRRGFGLFHAIRTLLLAPIRAMAQA